MLMTSGTTERESRRPINGDWPLWEWGRAAQPQPTCYGHEESCHREEKHPVTRLLFKLSYTKPEEVAQVIEKMLCMCHALLFH